MQPLLLSELYGKKHNRITLVNGTCSRRLFLLGAFPAPTPLSGAGEVVGGVP